VPLDGMTRRQWIALAKSVRARMEEHNLTLVAAGVAFYAFLALIPALVAIVSLYGLVANPSDVTKQVDNLSGSLPQAARAFMISQLHSIIASSSAGVSLALVVGIATALWSASAAMVSLVQGIDLAQGRRVSRKFVAKRGLALALTAGATALVIVVVLLVASAPSLLAEAGVGDIGRWILDIARWPLVAVIMVGSLATLYHVAAGRSGRPQLQWDPSSGPRSGFSRPRSSPSTPRTSAAQQDVRDPGLDHRRVALDLARCARSTHRSRGRRADG